MFEFILATSIGIGLVAVMLIAAINVVINQHKDN